MYKYLLPTFLFKLNNSSIKSQAMNMRVLLQKVHLSREKTHCLHLLVVYENNNNKLAIFEDTNTLTQLSKIVFLYKFPSPLKKTYLK